MNKIKSLSQFLAATLVLTLLFSATVFAHIPPTNGKVDCGIIMDGVFYSEYYSPPQGTPAVSGSCSWVKQGTSRCDVANYGGQNYNLYTYKWVCNAPIDDYIPLMLGMVGLVAFVKLRKLT